MPAPTASRSDATSNLNHLRRGATYRATTDGGCIIGEYLGMETPHGDRAILLRRDAGTASIALQDVTSIRTQAA